MIMRCDIARGWARCHNKERAIHVHLVNAITVNMVTFMGMRAGCGLKERCKNMVEQGTRWLKKLHIQADYSSKTISHPPEK